MVDRTDPPEPAEEPKDPPADKSWLEVENVRGDGTDQPGSWPLARPGD